MLPMQGQGPASPLSQRQNLKATKFKDNPRTTASLTSGSTRLARTAASASSPAAATISTIRLLQPSNGSANMSASADPHALRALATPVNPSNTIAERRKNAYGI